MEPIAGTPIKITRSEVFIDGAKVPNIKTLKYSDGAGNIPGELELKVFTLPDSPFELESTANVRITVEEGVIPLSTWNEFSQLVSYLKELERDQRPVSEYVTDWAMRIRDSIYSLVDHT